MAVETIKDKFCPNINDFCRNDCINFSVEHSTYDLITSTRTYDRVYTVTEISYFGLSKKKVEHVVHMVDHTFTEHSDTKYYSCRDLRIIKKFKTRITDLKIHRTKTYDVVGNLRELPAKLREAIRDKLDVNFVIANEVHIVHDTPMDEGQAKLRYDCR